MTDTYSLDTPYISIYDNKPSRRKPKQTVEEKAQKNRDNAAKYYNNNYDYCVLKHRLYAQTRAEEIKKKTTIDGYL